MLYRTTEEKDLGVPIADGCKMSKQCGQATVKANKILSYISRGFAGRKKEVLILLYRVLVGILGPVLGTSLKKIY